MQFLFSKTKQNIPALYGLELSPGRAFRCHILGQLLLFSHGQQTLWLCRRHLQSSLTQPLVSLVPLNFWKLPTDISATLPDFRDTITPITSPQSFCPLSHLPPPPYPWNRPSPLRCHFPALVPTGKDVRKGLGRGKRMGSLTQSNTLSFLIPRQEDSVAESHFHALVQRLAPS